jgi:hypothetical protein
MMPRLLGLCWTIVCLVIGSGSLLAADEESLAETRLGELPDLLGQVRPTAPPTGPGTNPLLPPTGQARPQATATTTTAPSSTSLSMIQRNEEPEFAGDFFVGRLGAILGRSRLGGGTFIAAHTPSGSRSLKIADNESPRPQDRVYIVYNYFDDYAIALNRRIGGDEHFFEHRETLGFEKTCLCGAASIGFRLPLSEILTDDPTPSAFTRGLAGTDTSIGDLSVIFKYAVFDDRDAGNLLSTGLVVTSPTGEKGHNPFHKVVLQPFVGYIYRCGDWFLHGFTSVDVPVDSDDSTLLFNDVGIGYFLYQCPDPCQCVTAVIPMFEVHVNTPLNHRGALGTTDPAGTSDTVDLTLSNAVELHQRARLITGLIIPVSGPRPFNFEIMTALNWRF